MEVAEWTSVPQCYCKKLTQDIGGMFRCEECHKYFHLACLKSGKPTRLVGDIFYNFTCSDCNQSGTEVVERMKKMSWLPVVVLALYNLQLSSTGKVGYYRWKEHICTFIESHWVDFFGPNRQKTHTWFGTVAGTLSSWCPVYFTSGMQELKQSGWWKLTNNLPPTLEILNARLVKKQKSPQHSVDINCDLKVEGLRNRVRKSTIEAAIELRAKRDIPSISERKRRKRFAEDVDVLPISSPQFFDDDDDFGSELTDNSQMTPEFAENKRSPSLKTQAAITIIELLDKTNHRCKDLLMSNSSFTAYDYMDQSSQMSRSSCRSDWLTEKDLVVGDTLPEYLLKEDEGKEDEDDDVDIDPCRLSPDQLMSPDASSDNLPQIGDILATLHAEQEYKPCLANINASRSCALTVERLQEHDSAPIFAAPLMREDVSSVDGEGVDRIQSGYNSDVDDARGTNVRNVKRKRTIKKELVPPQHPKTEKNPTVVPMSLYEEKQLLQKLKQKDYARAIATTTDVRLRRFHRKLCVRQQQREHNLRVFDLDLFMQQLNKDPDMPLPVYDFEQDTSSFEVKTEAFDASDERILDRYQHVQHQCRQTQPVSFLSRLIGSHDDQRQTIYSPYTQRVLKPFIRRDFESRPLKMLLLQEIIAHHHRNDPDWKPGPPHPIDYCYVKPQHIPAINALCREYFWPGIDMSESLMYPECSGVVLYRKLVIGFAFMVPANFNEMYISFLFTHPEWRRAGIASFLLYHLAQTYRRKELTLHVSASNPAMLLYQKFGFKPEQFIVDFYDKYFSAESTECRHAFFLRLVPPKEEGDTN